MIPRESTDPNSSIVSLFCDPFAAVAAKRQLTAIGVAESELDLIGFLGGQVPDWNPLLVSMGLPTTHADYYREEFEDGAVMLVIRAAHPAPRQSFLKVLRECGGLVHVEERATRNRGGYESQ